MLSPSQKFTLSQLFVTYKASAHQHDLSAANAWSEWIHENLNGGSNNPLEDSSNNHLEGSLSIELIYSWSAFRLSIMIVVPLLLSFTIGIWYMKKTGDVVAAWTISLYIVTSAAGKLKT